MISKQQAFFLGSFLLSAFYSVAQQVSHLPQENQLDFSLSSEYGTIDNFLFECTDEQRSNYWSFSPELYFQYVTDHQLLSFDAKTQLNKFTNFEQDDHSNVWLAPRYLFRIADNKTFFINANYQQTYEYRGTGLSLGKPESLLEGDDKQQSSVSLGYTHGDLNSKASLAIELGAKQSQYKTRRQLTKLLDHKQLFANAAFDYQLTGGTYVSSALELQQLTFEHQAVYDSKKLTALVGIKWPKSVISQFSLLLGYQHINFDQAFFANDNAFKWRASWRWSPVEATVFTFASERDFATANRLNDSYRLVDKHAIKITHQINDYFHISASTGLNQEQVLYKNNQQNEDYLHAEVTVDYVMSDNISLMLNYQLSDLDADNRQFEYQRNSISLGIKLMI